MATSEFSTKLSAKFDAVEKSLKAVNKLMASAPDSVNEDTVRRLNLIEDLATALGATATAFLELREDHVPSEPDTDPMAEGS